MLRLDKTVYSFKELVLLWPNADPKTIRSRISYYIKHKDLYHVRRGLYAKNKDYDRYELATQIYTPSYISFETVLVRAGIVFQYYTQIFVASYQTKTIECDGQTCTFKSIKSSILCNSMGIEMKENYSIAIPERAYLDILYLNKDYFLDNPWSLDWGKVFEILPIYGNKRMEKVVSRHHAAALNDLK